MRKKFTFVFVFLAFVVVILIAQGLYFDKEKTLPPIVKDGFIDLSQWNFEKDGPVNLNGQWAFYMNRFLTHEDFENYSAGMGDKLTIPSTQKSIESVHPPKDHKFYGTMRVVVKLPNPDSIFSIRTGIFLWASRLYVDGVELAEIGHPGNSKKASTPFARTIYTSFSPSRNEVEIIYHASDFYLGDSAIAAPTIGLESQISNLGKMNLGRDFFLFGMLLIMGLYHIGLFIIRRKDQSSLYFGIFCLAFALRMIIVGERYLPEHLELPFMAYLHMAYITVFIGFSALLCYIYHTVKELFQPWFFRGAWMSGAFVIPVSLIISYSMLEKLFFGYAIFGFSLIGYALVRLFLGAWRNVPSTVGVLVGFICIAAAFVNDLVYEMTLANRPSMVPIGVAIFTLTQAYTLSIRFSSAFQHAERLAEENAAISEELRRMNMSLESMVEERTSDLKTALAEVDEMSKTDFLTKLPNRRFMFEKIQAFIDRGLPFYIGLADLDRFKLVNDTYGHDRGDDVLRTLSDKMTAAIHGMGTLGRWGGEEFLFVIATDDRSVAQQVAENIRLAVEQTAHLGIKTPVTLTAGICKYSQLDTIDHCIANADKALYNGKALGRNQVSIFSKFHDFE